MHDPRLSHRSALTIVALTLSLSVTSGARAEQRWADELPVLRAALASYDLEGDATFGALEELGRVAAGSTEGAREARALRALVSADLLVISRSEARYAALEDRLAAMYGVTTLELHAHLLRELGTVNGGVYRRVVDDALLALALIDEIDVPIPIDWTRHGGIRRDVLFLRAAASGALQAGSLLDPCADASVECPAPWSGWDAPTRARIAALLEASAAAARLASAADSGDPLVRTLAPAIAQHRELIESSHVDPIVWLAARTDLLAADAGDSPVRVERLLVIGRDSLEVIRTPAVTVREGQVVSLEADQPAGLASSRFAAETLGNSLEEPLRVALGTIVRGAVLAIAPAGDASCELVWRVLAEARRMGVGSIVLLRRASDGSLAGEQMALSEERSSDERGEVVVRVRPAYLVIERSSEQVALIARTRGEGGLAIDLPELRRVVARSTRHGVTVAFAGEARADDVVQVALALAHGARAPVGLSVR